MPRRLTPKLGTERNLSVSSESIELGRTVEWLATQEQEHIQEGEGWHNGVGVGCGSRTETDSALSSSDMPDVDDHSSDQPLDHYNPLKSQQHSVCAKREACSSGVLYEPRGQPESYSGYTSLGMILNTAAIACPLLALPVLLLFAPVSLVPILAVALISLMFLVPVLLHLIPPLRKKVLRTADRRPATEETTLCTQLESLDTEPKRILSHLEHKAHGALLEGNAGGRSAHTADCNGDTELDNGDVLASKIVESLQTLDPQLVDVLNNAQALPSSPSPSSTASLFQENNAALGSEKHPSIEKSLPSRSKFFKTPTSSCVPEIKQHVVSSEEGTDENSHSNLNLRVLG